MASLFGGGGGEAVPTGLGANADAVMYMRSVGTIAGGCAAGALGLTGAAGLAFYPAVALATSAALALKTGRRPGDYFERPAGALLFAGAVDRSALLSYLLFWTLVYALRGA